VNRHHGINNVAAHRKLAKEIKSHQVDIEAKILQFLITLIIQFITGKQMFYYPGEEIEVAKY